MPAIPVTVPLDGWTNFTITLLALASGTSRQSTIVANTNNRRAGLVHLDIQVNQAAGPTNGLIVEAFMLFGDGAGNRTDNAGASDAGITIENAQLLGSLTVLNTAANKHLEDQWSTHQFGHLGTEFGIAVRNSTNLALSNTAEANFVKEFNTFFEQINT